VNIVFEYIKYRLNAKGRHGIHSPFIYDMVDKCFRIEYLKEDKTRLKSFINRLKKDTRSVSIEDFGAGSHKLGKHRKVNQILATSSSNGKFGKVFYQLAKHYQPSKILEFGTSLGIGTIHFALGNPNTKITTIEACPNTFTLANENFSELELTNVQAINSTFAHFLELKPTTVFDIVFIDGHHDGEALLKYCEKLQQNLHDETFLIIDDIRWSNSMFKAWNELKNSQEYHVSIDLFRMGILVRRKSQVKEHFVLKL